MRALPAGNDLPRAGQERAVKSALWFVTGCLAALAGCARLPGPMPVPQRQAPPAPASHYALLWEPSADALIAAGIDSVIHDDWRWAGRRAELRFRLDETRGVQFEAVLVVPDEFVRAGGRRIEVRINGRTLGAIPADRSGYQAWKQPVPEEWLSGGEAVLVEMTADAEWLQGNERRGYMLSSAGFTL